MFKIFSKQSQILLVVVTLISTASYCQNTNLIKPGKWLATIIRPDSNKIQFNFTSSSIQGKQVVYIINGTEQLLVDDITKVDDSVLLTLPFFNASLLVANTNTNLLKGFYIKKQNDKSIRIPFEAKWGIQERYPNAIISRFNASGSWDVIFKGKNSSSKAIGSFVQDKAGIVTGSFLTPTGDYRFLEGVVSGDTLKLSGFDGGFASYFEAKFLNDTTLTDGKYYAGGVGFTQWAATKNDTIQLPDEYGYSKVKAGEESRFNFKFKSTEGKLVSILDEKYKGKVVIVQILGSWCPNCMDETAFLSAYYNQNKNKGIEVIGLSYERNDNFE